MMDVFNGLEIIPGYTARMVMVNPSQATELLNRNKHNRRIRPAVVQKYARELLAGEWRAIPAGVGIDEGGAIIDGQHRLSAIVQSGKAAPLLIVAGFPHASQEKCDRHLRRSLGDVLALAGFAADPRDVPVAVFLARWKMANGNSFSSPGTWGMGEPADGAVRDMLIVHRAGIEATRPTSSGGGLATGIHRLQRVGIRAAIALYFEANPDKAAVFMKMSTNGVAPTRNHPVGSFLRALGSPTWNHAGGGGNLQTEDFRRTTSVLLAFDQDREISAVRRHNEAIPWPI